MCVCVAVCLRVCEHVPVCVRSSKCASTSDPHSPKCASTSALRVVPSVCPPATHVVPSAHPPATHVVPSARSPAPRIVPSARPPVPRIVPIARPPAPHMLFWCSLQPPLPPPASFKSPQVWPMGSDYCLPSLQPSLGLSSVPRPACPWKHCALSPGHLSGHTL